MANRTIIFDLGKVLIDFSFDPFYDWIENHTNRTRKDVYKFLKENQLIKDYELGKISSKVFFESLKEFLNTDCSVEFLKELWNDIFSPIEENIELLKELFLNKEKYKIQLGLLSNTNDEHIKYLEKHYDIFSLFDAKVFSYQVHLEKPQKEIYEYTLNLLKTKPVVTLFIDDKIENVEGAKELNIHSIHYQPHINLKNIINSFIKY